jgi:hypothetical protein
VERETLSEKIIDSKEIGNESFKHGKNHQATTDRAADFRDVHLSSITGATSAKGECGGVPNFLSDGAVRWSLDLLP